MGGFILRTLAESVGDVQKSVARHDVGPRFCAPLCIDGPAHAGEVCPASRKHGGSSPSLLGHTLFNPNLATIEYAGRRQHLTVRQSDILLLLAQDLGDIVERDFILERVWGNASYANSLALNVQISYLRHLLAADNTLAITSLKKRGYVLEVKTDGLKR
ncbi:MAG: winged helix-turn-helix transcriptional regulator [Bacteroidaceae bacterium]|nr:winged helix-turn-helix transcriptional regulator [Bacteroidaceae bacterium]